MAFDQLGLSFLPTADANSPDAAGGPLGGGRLEDVLRILSFRLPKVLGAHAIAPEALLNSPGGSAVPGGAGTGGDPLADVIARHVLSNMPNMSGASHPGGSFIPPGSGTGNNTPPPSTNYKPRIIPIPTPGGTAIGGGSGADMRDEQADIRAQLRGRNPIRN